MASMKRGAMVAFILMLVVVITSACNQPYSQQPNITNTPIPNNLFATPLGQPTNMTDVQNFATGTALAIQSGTPVAGAITATSFGNTPQGATITPTSIISLPTNAVTTPTATLAVATSQPSAAAATSVPGSRPATYTLQNGEYPYCIARRYNVDPDDLLTLNGLVDGQTLYYAGKVLTIPQTGTFPGNRMWHNHPDTYTVDSSSDTIYGIACYYGDVDPAAIASANGLSVGATLSAGQKLTIP